eukprot:6458451-Alexandrium_andersonii.AAC.1
MLPWLRCRGCDLEHLLWRCEAPKRIRGPVMARLPRQMQVGASPRGLALGAPPPVLAACAIGKFWDRPADEHLGWR